MEVVLGGGATGARSSTQKVKQLVKVFGQNKSTYSLFMVSWTFPKTQNLGPTDTSPGHCKLAKSEPNSSQAIEPVIRARQRVAFATHHWQQWGNAAIAPLLPGSNGAMLYYED